MATHYFPEDPVFLLRLASVLLRQDSKELYAVLDRAEKHGANPKHVSFLRCFEAIQKGEYVKARRYLEDPENRKKLSHSLKRTALFTLHMLRFRSFCRLSLLFILALSLNGVVLGLTMMWVLFWGAVLMFPLTQLIWKRRYSSLLSGEKGVFYSLLPSSDFQKIRQPMDSH